MKPGSLLDRTGMTFALFGQSAPVFWIGIMFILLFGVKLRWFPISGRGGIENLIMPAITLALFSTAAQTRLTRSSMMDVLDKDFIRTARSKGLHEFKVILKHGLKNALIPIITIVALQFGMMLSGAVITETIFAWPGVGRLAVNAIYNRDYPVIQAAVFVTSFFFVFINLIVDILYTKIDQESLIGEAFMYKTRDGFASLAMTTWIETRYYCHCEKVGTTDVAILI